MKMLIAIFHDFLVPILMYAHRKATEEGNQAMQKDIEAAMRHLVRIIAEAKDEKD